MRPGNSEPESSPLDSVMDIENRAEELIRKGQTRARETIERAKQEAERRLSEAVSEGIARAELIRKKGLLEIEQEVAEMLARGKKEADELDRKTGEHMDDAARFIIRMVTGTGE